MERAGPPPRSCFLPVTRRATAAEAEGAVSRYGGRPWMHYARPWQPERCCGAPSVLLLQLRTDELPGAPIPFERTLVQVRGCPVHNTRVAAALVDVAEELGGPEPAAPDDPAAIAITGWIERPDAPRAGAGLVQEDKLLGHPIVVQEWTAEILGTCPECGAPARPLFTVNDWVSCRPPEAYGLTTMAARSEFIRAAQDESPAPLDHRPATPFVFGDVGWLTVLFCPEHPIWVRVVTAQM